MKHQCMYWRSYKTRNLKFTAKGLKGLFFSKLTLALFSKCIETSSKQVLSVSMQLWKMSDGGKIKTARRSCAAPDSEKQKIIFPLWFGFPCKYSLSDFEWEYFLILFYRICLCHPHRKIGITIERERALHTLPITANVFIPDYLLHRI